LCYTFYSLFLLARTKSKLAKIGIPRSLGASRFYGFWAEFFKTLGHDVLIAPETDRKIIANASEICEPELCLPAKIYIAQCRYLAKNGADAIFSPCYESSDPWIMPCPKVIAINDLVRSAVNNIPQILQPSVEMDIDEEMFSFVSLLKDRQYGRQVAADSQSYRKAYDKALLSMKTPPFEDQREKKFIALLGHSYVLNDPFLTKNILNIIKRYDLGNMIPDSLSWKDCKPHYKNAGLLQPLHWQLGRKIIGFSKYVSLKDNIAGAIYVSAFGCALDEVLSEAAHSIMKEKNIPFSFIMMDEHTQPANINVRVEAFLEICKKIR